MAVSSGSRRDAAAPGVYAGQTAVLATMHGKEAVVAPAFSATLGIAVKLPPADLDTDALGTFSGEIERYGDIRETCLEKARRGVRAAGAALGIASEGAYGPHPVLPFVAGGVELMAFVDTARELDVVERLQVEKTNYATLAVAPGDDVGGFLDQAGFPRHALVVMPNVPPAGSRPVTRKGLTASDELRIAIDEMASLSDDRRALLQSDMRAHMNPTRMASIGRLARRLAARLMCYCPGCGAPGFGATREVAGLPCELCRTPTRLARGRVHGCAGCAYEIIRTRDDGIASAAPQYCDHCNP